MPYLRARAVELEREIGRLRVQRAGAAPASDALAPTLPFSAVRERLPREGVLLAYHIVGDSIQRICLGAWPTRRLYGELAAYRMCSA